MYVGTIVSMLAIALAPFAFADSNRYVNQFNPVGGETGTLYSGNVASTFAVDSNPIVVNETVVYDSPVIQSFQIPDSDLNDESWETFGCATNSYDCINDNPLIDGDNDTTYLFEGAAYNGPTNVTLSGGIPSDALIVPSEPFLLIRARVDGVPTAEFIAVDVFWRYESLPAIHCTRSTFEIISSAYVNYGVSMPDCDDTNQPWNTTMLNNLELTFQIPIGGNNEIVRLSMAYVRTHYRTVLYSAAVAWLFEFIDVQAQLINRIVWNCTHVGDNQLTLGIVTPPAPASRGLVYPGYNGEMCEGGNEDSFAPLYASDIDGEIGSVWAIINGLNETASPGFFSLDQIIIVQNGTKTTSVLDFGGGLCWLLGIALVFIAMITVIVIKKRKGGER